MLRIEEHFDVQEAGDIAIVRITRRRILDSTTIEEIKKQLFEMVEKENCTRMLIDIGLVEFMSSLMLNGLILLEKKIRSRSGRLVLCGMKREIYEVFVITRLHQFFYIKDTKEEGLRDF